MGVCMASFDIIDSIGEGYKGIWAKRYHMARLSVVPCTLKIILVMFALAYNFADNFVMQAIIFLPAFFAEGWVLVNVARLAFFEKKSQGKMKWDKNSALAGIVSYVLVRFLLTGSLAFFNESFGYEEDILSMSPVVSFMMVAVFVFFIWAFKYVWLYIPLSVGLSMWQSVRLMRGFLFSLPFIGIYLVSIIPYMFLLIIIAKLVLAPYDTVSEIPVLVHFVVVVIQSIFDMAANITVTLSIAYAFGAMVFPKGKSEN